MNGNNKMKLNSKRFKNFALLSTLGKPCFGEGGLYLLKNQWKHILERQSQLASILIVKKIK